MVSVEADDINRLIKINWSENVSADDVRECAEQLGALTADIRPGFRVLADLTGLESMDPTGASYIAAIMDLFAAKQVGLIVRVIPDPHKDIGLNILSYFHYGSQVQIVTHKNRTDALQNLSD
jgi:anti-anti-sigma regulatory factor